VSRSSTLERLPAIDGGGTHTTATIQVRTEDPTYDTVGEEDYATLVNRRHKDTGDSIIDDDSQ
jgi:DNA polymerase alpha subunit A